LTALPEVKEITVERYKHTDKCHWDRFVAEGKNSTFLLQRNYMDYHADRFVDHSLIVWREAQIVAVLPANLTSENTLVSHQGLSYGGFVFRRDVTLLGALEICQATLQFLQDRSIKKLVYKRVPSFYNTLPDGEMDYAMFLLDARLVRRDTAAVLTQADRLPVRRGKKSMINKGKRSGLIVKEDTDLESFWSRILEPRLHTKYGVKPVHSIEEIRLLADRFPRNIRLFSAFLEDKAVAGNLIFETPTVAHIQYSAIHPDGEPIAALDVLSDWLVQVEYKDKRFIDFGICNESNGRVLNHDLMRSKEGFGARTYVHDFYEVNTTQHPRLLSVLSRNTYESSHEARSPMLVA
jgi:hypothetical protein